VGERAGRGATGVGQGRPGAREGERSARLVADLEEVGKNYGDKPPGEGGLKKFTGRILRGEQVGLIGPNGERQDHSAQTDSSERSARHSAQGAPRDENSPSPISTKVPRGAGRRRPHGLRRNTSQGSEPRHVEVNGVEKARDRGYLGDFSLPRPSASGRR